MPIGHLWWVKRAGEPKGPYSAALIEKNIALGRIKATDQISADGTVWQSASDYPDFEVLLQRTPSELSVAPSDPWRVERGPLAEPPTTLDVAATHLNDERRAAEDAALVARELRSNRVWAGLRPTQPGRRYLPFLILAALTLGVFGLALKKAGYQPPSAQCAAPPAPGVNWEFCNLAGQNFHNTHLQGAILRNAQLAGANFTGADLRGADLAYANLTTALLRDARLSGARLTGASLHGATLDGADLQHAEFGYADLTGASLVGALLEDANFDQTILPTGDICAKPQLQACRRALLGPE